MDRKEIIDISINTLDRLTEIEGNEKWMLGGDTTIYRLIYSKAIDRITSKLIGCDIPYSITDSYIDNYKRVNVLMSEVIDYKIRIRDEKINYILNEK